ncbi:hypothetical protein [Iodidimonas sp. SYSU 1G8]|uniref:hypothetical protein n=1 Tax=Iodidimonas sp. SYSU 1G8 TaxID=3133967 RepID=UPI0031FE56E2
MDLGKRATAGNRKRPDRRRAGLARELPMGDGSLLEIEVVANHENRFLGVRIRRSGRGVVYCSANMLQPLFASLRKPGQNGKLLALNGFRQLRVATVRGVAGHSAVVRIQCYERPFDGRPWSHRGEIVIEEGRIGDLVALVRELVREARTYLIAEA